MTLRRSPLAPLAIAPLAIAALASCGSNGVAPDLRSVTGMYDLEEVNAARLPTQVATSFTQGTVRSGGMACDRDIHCQIDIVIDSAGQRRTYRLAGYFVPRTQGELTFHEKGGRPVFEATWDGGSMIRTQSYLEMAMAFRWTGPFRFAA